MPQIQSKHRLNQFQPQLSSLKNLLFQYTTQALIQQEKLKAEYTVNSTINRVEIKLESHILNLFYDESQAGQWLPSQESRS